MSGPRRRQAALLALGFVAAAVAGYLLWRPPARDRAPAPIQGASSGTAQSTSKAPAASSTRTPPGRRPAGSPGSAPPYLEVQGSSVTGSDERGRRQWDLKAQSLTVDSTRDTMTLERVTGTFFRQGAPAITLQAGTGVVRVRARIVELAGGVNATSADGRRLQAQQMTWSAGEERLVATGAVVFSEGKTTITADRLESDAGLQRTRFLGNVRVRIND